MKIDIRMITPASYFAVCDCSSDEEVFASKSLNREQLVRELKEHNGKLGKGVVLADWQIAALAEKGLIDTDDKKPEPEKEEKK